MCFGFVLPPRLRSESDSSDSAEWSWRWPLARFSSAFPMTSTSSSLSSRARAEGAFRSVLRGLSGSLSGSGLLGEPREDRPGRQGGVDGPVGAWLCAQHGVRLGFALWGLTCKALGTTRAGCSFAEGTQRVHEISLLKSSLRLQSAPLFSHSDLSHVPRQSSA